MAVSTQDLRGQSGDRAQASQANALLGMLARLDTLAINYLTRFSITLLRVSLGLVFLGFGVLKFFPGVSPAEGIAERTMDLLTLGFVSGTTAVVLVAAMETTIGLCLISGRYLRLGLALLGVAMIGILSPLVLFPGDLFAGDYNAPTLTGQYVLKDVVLFTASLVITARARGSRMVTSHDTDSSDASNDA